MKKSVKIILKVLTLQIFSIFCFSTYSGENAYIKLEIGSEAGGVVGLWDSELSVKQCRQGLDEKVDAQIKALNLLADLNMLSSQGYNSNSPGFRDMETKYNLAVLKSNTTPAICEAGKVASLTPGTKVELVIEPEECGSTMHKVVVKSGKYLDKIGCVFVDQITDKAPY